MINRGILTEMREIKFRAWETSSKKWVYGYYYMTMKNGGHIIIDDKGECWRVDPKTVGQYTGPQDKHGKDIYEGDILNTGDGVGWVGCVEFMYGRFILADNDNEMVSRPEWGKCEIIGNTYENPEPLNKGEK